MKKLNDEMEQTVLRHKAEQIVMGKALYSTADFEKLPKEDQWHMLHELQVHQIELQMQNEELRRVQVELETARSRYFDIYDLAPVGYLTLSSSGVILEANLAIATMLYVERGALINKLFSNFIFPEDQDIFYIHNKHLVEASTKQTFEIRMVKRDSTNFWARIEAVLAQEEGIQVRRIVLSEITLQKEAEDVLRKQKEKAESDHKEKSQFLANVSHDLRSPIHLLIYFIDTLNTINMDVHNCEIIEMIKRRGKGLKSLVDELLNISRLTSGKFPIRSDIFNLKEMLDIIVENEKIIFRGKDIKIVNEYRGDVKSFKGDSVKIDQIMTNILHNALKYTVKGKVKILTECAPDLKKPGKYHIKFSVKDTGIGIPADKIKSLFEPFTRFHGVQEGGSPEGSGLGLYIVKTLLDLLGGTVKATSEVGVGSTFTVELKLETAVSS